MSLYHCFSSLLCRFSIPNYDFNGLLIVFTKIGSKVRKTKNQDHIEHSTTDESDLSDKDSIFERITRSGNALAKIRAAMSAIDAGSTTIATNSMECILDCGRNKAMLLLPCQHQNTCKECWLLWKIESLKRISNEVLNSSYDDTLMQPKCPVCRQAVNKELIAFN